MSGVVIGIIQKGDRYAFLQRTDGVWTFPSGKVQDGETDEAAVLREIEEETGLIGEGVSYIWARKAGDIWLSYFFCRHAGGELTLKEPDKFLSADWKSAEEIIGIVGDKLFAPVRHHLERDFKV